MQISYRSSFRSAALALVVAGCSALLWGQAYTGGLRGRVIDEQGAVIANARVKIADVATNVGTETVTNSEGEFVFTSVNPGTYSVTAENPGFKKFERKVIIGTQQFITLDVKLEVGAVTESVVVNEETPLMETSNASQGTLLDRQKLIDLPNIGRNPFIMAWVAPNVVPTSDPRFVRFQDQSGSSSVSFAGGPQRGNVYLVDGVPITDGINRAVIIPSIEAVEEMKIQINTYDAELGRYAGGVYNTFLKSGTNDVHGSAFGSLRRTSLFANDFFANQRGAARPDSPYKLYGLSIGGPVVLPKIYNGRNKTFFWLVHEGYQQITGQFNTLTYPTPAEVNGDFSQSFNKDGSLRVIYDPMSGFPRTPFADNKIPQDRFNSIGRNIAQQFPAPNKDRRFYGDTNYEASANLYDIARETTGKVEHEFARWWRSNLSYLHYSSREPGADWLGRPSTPGAWWLDRWADVTTTNQIFTINPTTILSLRYGYVRFPNVSGEVGKNYDITKLGFPGSFASQIQGPRYPVFGFQDFTGQGCGCLGDDTPASRSFYSTLSKFAGRHSYKAGFQYREIKWWHQSYSGPGSFQFNNQFTARDPSVADGTGSSIGDLLLGFPSSGATSVEDYFLGIFKYYGGYFHDDFRLNPNLTLNLGVRYEYEQGYRDKNNHLVVGFDRNAVNPIAAELPPQSGVLPRGGLLYAGVDGNPISTGDPSTNRFAPRIGLAWRINDKTTIRGGYGLFWAPPVYQSLGAPGYAQSTEYLASTDGNHTPARVDGLNDPYPNGLLKPIGNRDRMRTGLGTGVGFWNEHMRHGGAVHQYSLDIQRTLWGGFNGSVAYVGSLSRHLQQNAAALQINQLDPSFFSQGESLLEQVPNPFFGLAGGTGFYSASTVSRAQLLFPYPEFTSVVMSGNDQMRARYDSLVLRVEKRFSGGLAILSHLTLSKARDASYAGTFFSSSNGFVVQNNYNYDAEYSLAPHHTPRRFVTTLSWDLPFGKGKKFFNGNELQNIVLGGWQLNVITTVQTGFPMSIGVGTNLNAFANAGQRPNATGTSPHVDGRPQDKLTNYFNEAAFSQPDRFQFGNLARLIPDRGPGQTNWDVSLFKYYKLKERVTLQFRAEAMNFTNTPRFMSPGGLSLGSGNFGIITGQANFPRFVQVGGRIAW